MPVMIETAEDRIKLAIGDLVVRNIVLEEEVAKLKEYVENARAKDEKADGDEAK